jgi:hypothetical protein
MSTRETGARLPVWPGVLLGAVAGAFATVFAALTSPELYIDWGSLAGTLVVVPLFTLGAAALVAIPLAARRRIAWMAVPLALVTALVVGELVFQASLDTPFARWSAARHWASVERRAATEREATTREVCRKVLAQAPIPPPAAPPGAAITPIVPGQATGTGASLAVYTRERCEELLAP